MTDAILNIPVADRSTLETYGNCPMAARYGETDIVSVGHLAEVGNGVHDAIGRAVGLYCDSWDAGQPMDARELFDRMKSEFCENRSDILHDAWEAARRSVWSVAKRISMVAGHNILRHDGGFMDRDGQMSRDLTIGKDTVRVTSEVDFLAQSQWPGVLWELDWKSGWLEYTHTKVESAFQFRLHATLIFHAYPEVEKVMVSVANFRRNNFTLPVEFNRIDDDLLWSEVSSRAGDWLRYRDKPAAECEARPGREKCRICNAAAMCNVVDRDIATVAENPQAALEWYIAAREHCDAVKGLLWAHVDKTGTDIELPDGTCFGYCRPTTRRKSPNPLYVANGDTGDEDTDE